MFFFFFDLIFEFCYWNYRLCFSSLASSGNFILESINQSIQIWLLKTNNKKTKKKKTTNLHEEYENLWNNYKSKAIKFSDFKKLPKEVQTDSAYKSPYKHRERRIYLRQELTALLHLFTSQPALMGPKFQVSQKQITNNLQIKKKKIFKMRFIPSKKIKIMLSGLAMAKEEIMWYFRHIAKPQIVKNKKGEQEDFKDNRISNLIFLVDQLYILARKYKNCNKIFNFFFFHNAHFLCFPPKKKSDSTILCWIFDRCWL